MPKLNGKVKRCRVIVGWGLTWLVTIASSAAWAAGGVDKAGVKKKDPIVIVHPLTAEERLGEDDLMLYDPLMGDASPFEPVGVDRVESRSEKMDRDGFKTDAPFVDWAHYAVLAAGSLDPKSADDAKRLAGWGEAYERHRVKAKSLFEANYEGRVESIADNGLCAYRDGVVAKRACVQAARTRAKMGAPALGLSWASWLELAAMGLAQNSGWPARWEVKSKALLESGKTEEQLAELLLKMKRLDAWAVKLNPAEPVIPYDALEQARAWAARTCWTPAKQKKEPLVSFFGECPSAAAAREW